MSLKKELADLLEGISEEWTPEDLSLAKEIAADYADLMVRQIAGEAVEGEILHIRAQAQAIIVAGTVTAEKVIEDRIRDFLGNLISDLLPII